MDDQERVPRIVEEHEAQGSISEGFCSEDDDDGEKEDDEEDNRMMLTEEERGWAAAIKNKIENDTDMESMSDFWYAQLALVCQNDMDRALECAGGIQHFLQEYEVAENLDFAQRIGKEFQQLLPTFWIAHTFNERDGNYVLVCDAAGFYAKVLTDKEANVRTWMMATFFINHALCPDFAAIRQGVIFLVENEGFDWKVNSGVGIYRKLWQDMCAYYPFRIHKCKNFNTGVFVNLLTSMAKAFIPARLIGNFDMGCQCELARLDKIYMVPNVQAANERFLESTAAALEKRFTNEASFSL